MSNEQHISKNEAPKENASEIQETSVAEVTAAEHAHAEHKKKEALTHARHEATVESADKRRVLEKIDHLESQTDDDVISIPVNSDLKKSTFQKEIKHIRRKLTPNERAASKVIHQKIVRNISEVSSKTLTRPSGLLGGGIVALLGTSAYLYLTKDIGIRYNYTVFLVLLVLGFVIGLMLEAVIRLSKQRKSI